MSPSPSSPSLSEVVFSWSMHALWLLAPVLIPVALILGFTEAGSWQRWVAAAATVAVAWKVWGWFWRRWARLRMTRRIYDFLCGDSLWTSAGQTPRVVVENGRRSGTFRVTVRTPRGATDRQVADVDDRIAAHLRATLVAPAEPSLAVAAGEVRFSLALTPGVLVQEVLDGPLPAATLTPEALRIPVGETATGEVRAITPWSERQGAVHVWTVGSTGTGKSSVSTLLTRSYLDQGLSVWAFDPSGATLKSALKDCTAATETPAEVLEMLRGCVAEMRMREEGLKCGLQPRPGLIVLEEVENLLVSEALTKKEQTEIAGLISTLAKEARKSGLSLAVTTQNSDGDAIVNTKVRSQFKIAFVFPLPLQKALMVLDDSAAALCASLRGGSVPPGVCVLRDDTDASEVSGAGEAVRMAPASAHVQPVVVSIEDQVNEIFDEKLEHTEIQESIPEEK